VRELRLSFIAQRKSVKCFCDFFSEEFFERHLAPTAVTRCSLCRCRHQDGQRTGSETTQCAIWAERAAYCPMETRPGRAWDLVGSELYDGSGVRPC
jgi:hypothetical protein